MNIIHIRIRLSIGESWQGDSDLGICSHFTRRINRRECNLCDHTFIENDVTLGDRVTVNAASNSGMASPWKMTCLSVLMQHSPMISSR